MAKRIVFISERSNSTYVKEHELDFEYFTGFSLSQKRKSIQSLHKSFHEFYPLLKVLEVSTKADNELGEKLSAFNLKYYDEVKKSYFSVENIFQSSKVFELGGPFRDLLHINPNHAKGDERLTSSGNLKYFSFNGQKWGLEPKTMFYDWIYINALNKSGLQNEIVKYDAFTDIEFNHKKSINCQARACAIFVSLYRSGDLKKTLENVKEFEKIYQKKDEQISFSIG